jgi:sarcosine oxidase delta subunit
MGKSSLMVRTTHKLRERNIHAAVLDLAALGQNVTSEQWYYGLTIRLGRQWRLEDELENFWQDNLRLGPCQRWFAAIRDVVLEKVKITASRATENTPRATPADADQAPGVVVFIDELDAVRSLPFSTDEFFAAIRECYHRRAEDPELNRLTFCLLGVAAP